MKLKVHCESGTREVVTNLSKEASYAQLMSWLYCNVPDCIAYEIL